MLQLHYNLGETDYHTHLLYTVSNSSSASRTRTRIRLLMTIGMFLLAAIAFGNKAAGQTIYFVVLGILCFIFLPRYTRWSYKKTYLKHVRNYYKDRMSEPTDVEIGNQKIHISDSQGESTLPWNELEAVVELKDYCYLKTLNGPSIIIPIYQLEQKGLVDELKSLASQNKIDWKDEKEWVWK